MPNIIAIIDDKKIRNQIEGFFREIDAEGIRFRSFTSGAEFEKKYFAAKKAAKLHPLNQLQGFDKFSYEQLDATLDLTLTTKPSLPHKTLKLKINGKTLKIASIEPAVDANQSVLGLAPEDLQNQTDVLNSQILPAFHEPFALFWKKCEAGQAFTVLPFKTSGTEMAWFKLSGQSLSSDTVLIQIEDITDTYRTAIEAEVTRRQSHQDESEELQLMSEIDMVIVKNDCITGKVPPWMDQTWRKLKDGGYFPKEKTPRFVLLKYEDDGVSKLDVLHPRLDDLIYLPLDRLIFLQKMEIILALPKRATPTFLFTQDVHIDIEISKITKIERLSDLGLAIRNPVRLTPGLLAHFFVTFPNEENPIDIWGKVIHSEPHPERQHEFLVYFSFFGLPKKDATVIKRYLTKGARFQPFINSERRDFVLNPQDLFVSDEDRRMRQVVILDVDEEGIRQIKQNLTKDVGQIKCASESGYASLYGRYLRKSSMLLAEPAIPASTADLFSPSISCVVNVENHEIVSNLTVPVEGQTYFGHPAVDIFANPLGWQKPILDMDGNDEVLTEILSHANLGREVHRILTVLNNERKGRLVHFKAKPSDKNGEVKVEITQPTPEALKAYAEEDKLAGMDVVIVDPKLVPGGRLDAFMENLTEHASQAGLLQPGQRPKIILVVDDESKLDPRLYSNPHVIGLLPKPIEMRQLSFLVATATKTRFSIYSMANLGWASTLVSIHVARDVHLETLSEFGASIRHSRPIAPGTVLFLRGGIFDNAPNRCLAARFYHCEEHPKEKGQYLCLTTYFGINDGFMKYARKWFRESYAATKQAGGGD